jgi:hypothetical protein
MHLAVTIHTSRHRVQSPINPKYLIDVQNIQKFGIFYSEQTDR